MACALTKSMLHTEMVYCVYESSPLKQSENVLNVLRMSISKLCKAKEKFKLCPKAFSAIYMELDLV